MTRGSFSASPSESAVSSDGAASCRDERSQDWRSQALDNGRLESEMKQTRHGCARDAYDL